MIIVALALFGIGSALLLDNDKHHTEWKKRNPNAWVYPGTPGSHIGCVLMGLAIMAFIFTIDPSSWQSFKEAFHGTFN